MNRVTGSIQNKNNKGIYHMMVRIKKSDGSVVSKSKSTGIKVGRTKTEDTNARRDANNMLSDWIKELEKECGEKSNQRIIQAIDDWLIQKKNGAHNVRENTYQCYVSYAENHIKPYFCESNPYIKEIKYKDVQGFVDYLAKTLKPQTIKKVLVILRGTFDEAVRNGDIDYNPCDKLKPLSAKKYKAQTFDKEQAIMLINAIEQDYNMVGIMLALFLGLRRSEIAGLRWQDVDLENDKVFIRNTVTRFSGIIETQQTKSESSQRDLSIPLHLHNYLVKVKAHQERNRELCGYDYADDVHVCVWDNGTPQSPEYPYHALKRLEKKLELPNVRLHDLRHTVATLLVDDGTSIVKVRDLLGHDDIATTAGIYVHTGEAAKKDVSAAIDRILSAV